METSSGDKKKKGGKKRSVMKEMEGGKVSAGCMEVLLEGRAIKGAKKWFVCCRESPRGGGRREGRRPRSWSMRL
jgi:hypothetical protein